MPIKDIALKHYFKNIERRLDTIQIALLKMSDVLGIKHIVKKTLDGDIDGQ